MSGRGRRMVSGPLDGVDEAQAAVWISELMAAMILLKDRDGCTIYLSEDAQLELLDRTKVAVSAVAETGRELIRRFS